MDSRAKQRLTGAVILVALFVLLVPELLTGPRGADTPGTPAEEGMRRYTIDLNSANPAAPPTDLPATPPAVALPEPAPANAQPPQLAKPGEQAAPAIVEPPPAAAPPAPATTPVPVAQQAPAERPAPRVEAQQPAATAPVAKGSFAVQLGSFRSRENADGLVRDMTAKGFTAFIAPTKTGGHDLYRVRVGPTRDRAQAEALAAQLRRIGQSGAIVPIS